MVSMKGVVVEMCTGGHRHCMIGEEKWGVLLSVYMLVTRKMGFGS